MELDIFQTFSKFAFSSFYIIYLGDPCVYIYLLLCTCYYPERIMNEISLSAVDAISINKYEFSGII